MLKTLTSGSERVGAFNSLDDCGSFKLTRCYIKNVLDSPALPNSLVAILNSLNFALKFSLWDLLWSELLRTNSPEWRSDSAYPATLGTDGITESFNSPLKSNYKNSFNTEDPTRKKNNVIFVQLKICPEGLGGSARLFHWTIGVFELTHCYIKNILDNTALLN